MGLSDLIARQLQQMLAEADGVMEIQRNELAGRMGCAPSQINYVLTSRFTPDQGYLVESRRGGGGYIRITRVNLSYEDALARYIGAIGDSINPLQCRLVLENLMENGHIDGETAALMGTALSDKAYRDVPVENRDRLRASILKNMLLTIL